MTVIVSRLVEQLSQLFFEAVTQSRFNLKTTKITLDDYTQYIFCCLFIYNCFIYNLELHWGQVQGTGEVVNSDTFIFPLTTEPSFRSCLKDWIKY